MLAVILPFIIYGMNVTDSFFEGISGYTTTGATIVDDLGAMPDSLLLWRGIIQWTGGITVLISFAFLLPAIGMGAATSMGCWRASSDTVASCC